MKRIESRDNPFYKQLHKLAESGRERRKLGRTLLDGVHLVESYEARHGTVERLVVMDSALDKPEVAALLGSREATVIPDALMRALGLVDTPSGLLAVIEPPAPPAEPALDVDCILLDGVQDPGNVGTLLRTAAAAGVRQALLAPGCAATWSPKVLRAGQGAHFALDIFEDVDLAAFMAGYRGTTAVTTLDEAQPLFAAHWQGPLAWVFGAEGQGVREALVALAGLRIRIPMPGQVESLNVAAAAAICLFEAVRRRSA